MGIVKTKKDKDGFEYFIAEKPNGERKKLYIHEEVYKAFVGEIPAGFKVIHKDGNKSNNCVWNLELEKIVAV